MGETGTPPQEPATRGAAMNAAFKFAMARLKAKSVRYWLTAAGIFVVAVTGSPYFYSYLNLTEHRSTFFQWLLERPRTADPKFVKVVLIEDDEYWKGSLAGRRPIKRDYLARLVDKLVRANAHVIALDFDVRLPDPQVAQVPADYQAETQVLIGAIANAARHEKKLVLATTLSQDQQGRYWREPDIYQLAGFCGGRAPPAGADPLPTTLGDAARNISCGHIQLPYDPLVVPLRLAMGDGSHLDSFALAVARAREPRLIEQTLARIGTNIRYGNFISEEKFADYGATFSAKDVLALSDEELRKKIQASTVIVGANWSTFAADRGSRVDLHWTPLGQMVGAILHANFAEALLDSRTFAATPSWILHATEMLYGLIAALTFALIPGYKGKAASFVALIVLLFVLQWSALLGFGIFFDTFVPLLGLALHSIYERIAGGHDFEADAGASA